MKQYYQKLVDTCNENILHLEANIKSAQECMNKCNQTSEACDIALTKCIEGFRHCIESCKKCIKQCEQTKQEAKNFGETGYSDVIDQCVKDCGDCIKSCEISVDRCSSANDCKGACAKTIDAANLCIASCDRVIEHLTDKKYHK